MVDHVVADLAPVLGQVKKVIGLIGFRVCAVFQGLESVGLRVGDYVPDCAAGWKVCELDGRAVGWVNLEPTRLLLPVSASGRVVEHEAEGEPLPGADHGHAVPDRRGRPAPC